MLRIFVDVDWVGQKKSKNVLTYNRDGPVDKLILYIPGQDLWVNEAGLDNWLPTK